MTSRTQKTRAERPLSPHLQIYSPQITSVMSILHRLTGIALVAGTIPLVLWIWAAAYSPECYTWLSEHLGSWYGMTLLFGWSLAFYFHLGNGLRHLWWDMGRGFELDEVNKTGMMVVIFTILATAITWIYIGAAEGI